MTKRAFLVLIALVLSPGFLQQAASAEELTSAPVYSVAEIVFAGPGQTAADAPARDVQIAVCFGHESGSPDITVQGFFDGDGWELVDVESIVENGSTTKLIYFFKRPR